MVPVEVSGQVSFPAITTALYRLTLTPYALHWFALQPHPEARVPEVEEERTIPMLTVLRSWENVFQGRAGRHLAEVLAGYLARCRWLAGHPAVRAVTLRDRVVLTANSHSIHLCLVAVELIEGEPRTCVLPLTFTEDLQAATVLDQWPHTVVARVTVRGEEPTAGVLHDAMADPALLGLWLSALEANQHFRGASGEVAALREAPVPVPAEDQPAPAAVVLRDEAWDALIALGERLVLKALRHVEPGLHAEVEILRALRDRTAFTQIPHLLGTVEYRPERGQSTTLALLLELPTTGQVAWRVVVDSLGRYCEHVLTRTGEAPVALRPPASWRERLEATLPVLVQETLGQELPTFALLGKRIAHMHGALAGLTDDPAFVPEPFTQGDQRSHYQAARTDCRRSCLRLRRHLADMPEPLQGLAMAVIDREATVLARLKSILEGRLVAQRQRVHGHLDLLRVMWTGKDFVIGGPGGDPSWPLTERRRKRSPLYDVAAMLRSFAHAAWTAAREGSLRLVDLPALEPWLELWQEGASLTFVQAYLETAREYDFLPDPSTCARLLDFFLLQHAMNELHDAVDHPGRRLHAVLEATLRLIDQEG
jgi:maltose alpha-D-glucosyltransferase/alpha-amylase